MNLKTAVVIVKGLCYLIVGVFTPWASALAQWANSGEWPSKIVWLGVILPASAIGGASSLLAFLSSSYKTYTDDREPKVIP
jgi:TRAP-type C4-dicarboxylate transport system permease small subunit